MKKIWNKKRIINDYPDEESELEYNYKKNYYNKIKYPKNSDYNNYQSTKYKKYINENKNNGKYSHRYPNFNECDSFYPKNYPQTEKLNELNDNESNKNNLINSFPKEAFNNYKNNEIIFSEKKEKNYNKKFTFNNNEQIQNENLSKIREDKIKEKISHNTKIKNKSKKFGIKNIPHPKLKKEHENVYSKGKKIKYIQKKEEKIKIKKERKLSFSSSQNSESTKQSFNTPNTSCSTNKEKDVSQEIKIETDINNNIINNQNNNFNKNKFDEEIKNDNEANIKTTSTINILENTEVLKVQVKISENKTATFKIKKYDDLFLTISLFCEIYSIDEKLMKPLIIKSLSALNTIYQIYNSDISQENIEILKTIKNFDDTK